MTTMDTSDVQKLNFAILAAMRAVQNRTGQQGFEGQPQISETTIDQVRSRLKDVVRERVVSRIHERIAEGVRDRVRDMFRERLATELRKGLIEAQSERGFDFSRIEKRLSERLTDVIVERIGEAVRERGVEVIRERLGDAIREA